MKFGLESHANQCISKNAFTLCEFKFLRISRFIVEPHHAQLKPARRPPNFLPAVKRKPPPANQVSNRILVFGPKFSSMNQPPGIIPLHNSTCYKI